MVTFPIIYLGVPLSTGPIPRSFIRPLVEKVAKNLPTWKGPLMPKSGRLVLTKAVLSIIPTYMLMADQLPAWAIEDTDRIRRKFLWAGRDTSIGEGECLVAWPTVCLLTIHGGLGMQNLKLARFALRTRWLWLQWTDLDRAWAALPMRVEPQVQDLFDASIQIQVGDGAQTLFWRDNWLDGRSVDDLAPTLVALISLRTVAQPLTDSQWVRDITSGLSVTALVEYLHLWDRLASVHLNTQGDIIRWRWTTDGMYSEHSAYLLMDQGISASPVFRERLNFGSLGHLYV